MMDYTDEEEILRARREQVVERLDTALHDLCLAQGLPLKNLEDDDL